MCILVVAAFRSLSLPFWNTMKPKILLISIALFLIYGTSFSQQPSSIKRTTYKSDVIPFGSGGTLSIIGAPNGSIKIEGWQRSEIEINAEIEVAAGNDADLKRLSSVVGFITEESLGRTAILTIGPHDRKAIMKLDKKFPKHLIGSTYAVNYTLKVPRYIDLQIDGGKGDLVVTGVDGMIKLNHLDGNSTIDLVGGSILATIGSGTVNITIPTRSWRGRFAEINLAKGEMNISLPTGLNAYFDASILRSGRIDNQFTSFAPRDRKGEFTERSIVAKTGTGSVPLKFTIGDGTMRIREIGPPGA